MAARSIDRRLTQAVVSTTAASVLVACLLFVLYDVRTGRTALVEKSEMLARVVGMSSAVAMAFRDDLTARETLDGLSGTGVVRAAAIYDQSGERFVEYLPEGAGDFRFPELQPAGRTLSRERLDWFEALVFEGEEVGTLYIAFDASGLTDRIGWYAMIVAVVMAGAALWSAWVASRLRRHVSTPIMELAEATRAIAQGDLSTHAVEGRDDEIGALAHTFNEMTGSLRGVVAQTRQSIGEVSEVTLTLEYRGGQLAHEAQRQSAAIAESSDSLQQVGASVGGLTRSAARLAQTAQDASSSIHQMQAAIGEIAAHMDQLASAIDTTSAATGQVTTNIDHVVEGMRDLQGATADVGERLRELTRSVGRVKDDAAECLEISESAGRDAGDGRKAVGETIQSMGAISGAFHQLENRVSRLAKKSQAIGQIVQVIKDVAEQTGLLSLNASIIAAQAGEHGHAFSVVADQVSSLADRSHRSAREIADLIREVQEDTQAAVGAVDQGSAVVAHGVQRSEWAGKVLERILEGTETSTSRVRQIVDATQLQSEDLRRVEQAVEAVATIVETIDRSTQHQHDATSDIARAIDHIRTLGAGVRQSTDEQRKGSALIAAASANLSSMANEMADALESQSRSSETIQAALQVFVGVAEETTRGVDAINESVATLSQRAKQLEEEIGRFRTGRADEEPVDETPDLPAD